jgi:hypothetical protein
MLLQANAKTEDDPNYIRVEDGKIHLGLTCPYKGTKRTRIIVEAVISGRGKSELSLDEKQKEEFESYVRSYLNDLEEITVKTAKPFPKDVEQKLKEMLELEKSPKMKIYSFQLTSSRFKSRVPEE